MECDSVTLVLVVLVMTWDSVLQGFQLLTGYARDEVLGRPAAVAANGYGKNAAVPGIAGS